MSRHYGDLGTMQADTAQCVVKLEPDTVISLAKLIRQQAAELRSRAMQVADCIAGARPATDAANKESEPDCLISELRATNRLLSQALGEIDRSQGAL